MTLEDLVNWISDCKNDFIVVISNLLNYIYHTKVTHLIALIFFISAIPIAIKVVSSKEVTVLRQYLKNKNAFARFIEKEMLSEIVFVVALVIQFIIIDAILK